MSEPTNEVALIDLSSIAYPIWHTSQSEPDANHASQQIVARVRTLAQHHPHAAICCDSGRSFRRDLSPAYKANRPEHDASLQHQIELAKAQLAADGFPIWSVKSFEADDLIGTATVRARALNMDVLIVSSDKDLLQLVGDGVRAMSATNGTIFEAPEVIAKFGVTPGQMRDYLTLVGDASDNIKGAPGIGEKKAAELLKRYGSLDEAYADLALHPSAFKPALATSLHTFRPQVETTRALVTLRTDAPIDFDEIARERVPQAVATFDTFETEDEMDEQEQAPAAPAATGPHEITPADTPPNPPTAMVVREPDVLQAAPAEWERGLDPRSMKDARILAKDMHDSHMFSAYGSPQAVLATVIMGRELGLPAMASLRGMHVIEGKHSLSASLMVALVLKSGLAEYFEPVEFSAEAATFETKRKGARNPVKLTHTVEMARQAWSKTDDAWLKSGWGRNPTDMLVARATARLARMVYPDLLAGLYTPEELQEIREDKMQDKAQVA